MRLKSVRFTQYVHILGVSTDFVEDGQDNGVEVHWVEVNGTTAIMLKRGEDSAFVSGVGFMMMPHESEWAKHRAAQVEEKTEVVDEAPAAPKQPRVRRTKAQMAAARP